MLYIKNKFYENIQLPKNEGIKPSISREKALDGWRGFPLLHSHSAIQVSPRFAFRLSPTLNAARHQKRALRGTQNTRSNRPREKYLGYFLIFNSVTVFIEVIIHYQLMNRAKLHPQNKTGISLNIFNYNSQ